MSRVKQPLSDIGPLRREAIAWIERLTSGQTTEKDVTEFKSWHGQSAAHAEAFGAARRLWSDIGPAGSSLRRESRASSDRAPAHVSRGLVSRRLVVGGTLAAASLGVVAMIRPPLGLWPSLTELSADYRTNTGEQRDVTLADAVSMRMNTQTSVSLQSPEANSDRVRLIAGELAIATNGKRALAVAAADGEIVATSARFGVRYLSSAETAVWVTCMEGIIRITRRDEERELNAGQQLDYDDHGLGSVVKTDVEAASAWERGFVIFRSAPLARVVDEINRYRPGRVVLLDAQLGRQQLSGRFDIGHINDVLNRIQIVVGARVRTLPGGLVLLG